MAFLAVQAFRRQPATIVGPTILSWLHAAYGWQPREHIVNPPYSLLTREGQRMLLRVVAGDRRPSWVDIDELVALGVQHRVDVTAIAAPAGVPDREDLLGTRGEDVVILGSLELERIYVEIEHELGGVGL